VPIEKNAAIRTIMSDIAGVGQKTFSSTQPANIGSLYYFKEILKPIE
jgi:hypothetical protein